MQSLLHPTLLQRWLERGSTNFLPNTLCSPLHFILGKMQIHFYFFLTILVCLSSRYSFMEIKLELQRNILKFGYGINYKYEGMLAYTFDRFYVITIFVFPTLDDLKLSPIRYDKECNYLRNLIDEDNDQIKENIKDLLFYFSKLRPFMAFYKMQILAHNLTAHKILKNEVDLIFPRFHRKCRNKKRNFWSNNFRIFRFSFWRYFELFTS